MKLKSTLLALGLVVPASVFATDYYVTVEGTGDKQGGSWDNAMAFTDFCGKVGESDGDTFKFGIGKYIPAAPININKGIRLEGGYDPATGTASEAGRTVFSGDLNGDGVANAGDLQGIIILKEVSEASSVVIRGIDFTSVYNNSGNNDAEYGALYMYKCNKVTVRDCDFYDNESTGQGGIAVRSKTSVARFLECSFTKNKANSHGAAVRMNSNSNGVGSVTFERCVFTNNSVNAATGSVICVQHAKSLHIVNSLITNNTAASGGAVFVNGYGKDYSRELCIVNSTIAGNNHNQVYFPNNGNLKIVNSIVVGSNDNGTTDNAAIVGAVAATTVSGGYNMLGTCPNDFPAAESDMYGLTGDECSKYFADADFTKGIADGKIPNGASEAELKEAVSEWGIDGNVNINMDINNARRYLTIPGAYKAKAITSTITVGDDKVATYYNNEYGYTMPDELTGHIVTAVSGTKVVTTEAYTSKTNVPRGAALIVAGEKNEYTVELKLAETKEDGNLLKGTQEAQTITATGNESLYKLANDNGIGFFWDSQDGKSLDNGANKCYLALDETMSAGARGFYLSDSVTGITTVNADNASGSDVYYTLSGVRVANPQKGVFIKNGKKVVIR